MRGKITRMVGLACLMLTVCLAPSQTNYALAMAGKAKLDNKLHHGLSLLVFINSCANPFIYVLSNRNYRLVIWKLLSACSGRDRRNILNCGRIHPVLLGTSTEDKGAGDKYMAEETQF